MNDEIFLRPLTIDDAAISWRWRNDPDIWQYTEKRPDREITEKMEREWAARVISDVSRINYAICLKPSGKYIGNIYLVGINGTEGELGIFIGEKSCQGKGFGRKALEKLKEILYDRGITAIHIDVALANSPALITYLRAGAKFDENRRMGMTLQLH